jgi:uncharacterized membrane protein
LFKKISKEKLDLCYSLQAHDPLNFVKMNYSLILSSLSMILFFLLILTRLCVWIKGLFSEFSYCALDLLISIDSLVWWWNNKSVRAYILWFPPQSHMPKWNLDGSSIGKPSFANVRGVFHNIKAWCLVFYLLLLWLKIQMKMRF